MLGFIVRRIAAAAPVFLAFAIGLFVVIASAPPPPGLTEEERARRFIELPLIFNVDPADRPHMVATLVTRLANEEGVDRQHDVSRLLRIGAAGLADLVPALEPLSEPVRARISRELAPLAFRMGVEDVADLDSPVRADRFWRRVLEERGIDLRPATVRRALRRHLAERSEPLYARQLSNADTAALAPLIDALEGTLAPQDREEVETLAIAAAIKAGANDVSDMPSLRAWWGVHRAEYVEFDPVERIAAHVTETRLGRWTITAITQRMGRSWRTDAPVVADLVQRAPATLLRSLIAIVLAHFIAVPLAFVSAARRGKTADRLAAASSIFFHAVPAFVMVLLVRAMFPGDMGIADAALVGALALGAVAPISRQARAAVLDVLAQDYVRVVRAKGISRFQLWTKHVARSALAPIVALGSVQAPIVLGGALVAEEILDLDGLGRGTMAAIRAHDLPWLMALAMMVATLTLFVAVAADIGQAALDPRVRASLRSEEKA
jgi:peptide/nickel transport system permease protein